MLGFIRLPQSQNNNIKFGTIERCNTSHVYPFPIILKILPVIQVLFLPKKPYELCYFWYQYQKLWYWCQKYLFFNVGWPVLPYVCLTPANQHFCIHKWKLAQPGVKPATRESFKKTKGSLMIWDPKKTDKIIHILTKKCIIVAYLWYLIKKLSKSEVTHHI